MIRFARCFLTTNGGKYNFEYVYSSRQGILKIVFWVNDADSLGEAGLPDNFEQSSRPHGTGLTDDVS